MKNVFIASILMLWAALGFAQIDLSKKIPGIKYENQYTFSSGVEMVMDFYDAKGKDYEAIPYFSFFNEDVSHICIKHQRRNTVYQTIFDMPNNNCLIILGDGDQIMGSASVMKAQDESEFKTLDLSKTEEVKTILGYPCTKYTFTAPKFTGELWATTEVKLKNDVGVLKASKMGKYYQIVPVEGFVLEITTVTTKKGKRTVMQTTAIKPDTNYKVSIPAEFGTAINKVDYYSL